MGGRTPEPGREVYVDSLPQCDICAMLGVFGEPAHYDGATNQGPWAYMCEAHYQELGLGLGLGVGQRLIVRPKDA